MSSPDAAGDGLLCSSRAAHAACATRTSSVKNCQAVRCQLDSLLDALWPAPPLPLAACGSFNYTSPTSNYSYLLNNCNNATFDEGEYVCNSIGGHLVTFPTKADQEDAESYYTQLGGWRSPALLWRRLCPELEHPAHWMRGSLTSCWACCCRRAAAAVPQVLLDGPQSRGVAQVQVGNPSSNGYTYSRGFAAGMQECRPAPTPGEQCVSSGCAGWRRWLDGTPGPNITGAYQHWGYYMPQNIIEPNNFFRDEHCGGANYTEAWNSSWGWSDFKCNRPSSYMCRVTREQEPGHAWDLQELVLLENTWPVQPCLQLISLTPGHSVTAPAAATAAWYYTSDNTGDTYAFGTWLVGQVQAQSMCNEIGSHLITWTSSFEQQEVEKWVTGPQDSALQVLFNCSGWSACGGSRRSGRPQQPAPAEHRHRLLPLRYYVEQGYLLPTFHGGYWMGMRANPWPNWSWIDVTGPRNSYSNWGMSSGGRQEPSNKLNTCGAGNFTISESYPWKWSGAFCNVRLPFMCRMLRPGNITLQSNITGHIFSLVSVLVNQPDAGKICNDLGGHLAAWTNQDEQVGGCRGELMLLMLMLMLRGRLLLAAGCVLSTLPRSPQPPCNAQRPTIPPPTPQVEMEYAFLQTGYLLPSFHKAYWLGLTAASSEAWPLFTWTDQNVPGPMDHYTHWGTAIIEAWPTPEPNNQDFPENCATAIFAQAYGFPSAWGWGDANCNSKAAVMCRRLRGWPCCPNPYADVMQGFVRRSFEHPSCTHI